MAHPQAHPHEMHAPPAEVRPAADDRPAPPWLVVAVTALAIGTPIFITSHYLAPSPQMLLLAIGAAVGWCCRRVLWEHGVVSLVGIIFAIALLGTSPVSIIAFATGCAVGHFICRSMRDLAPPQNSDLASAASTV